MKEYLVTASQMKRYDTNTIEKCHIPALVLMERSALVTVEELRRVCGNHPYRVLVVAGGGNNGGDGLAVGRLLCWKAVMSLTCCLEMGRSVAPRRQGRQILCVHTRRRFLAQYRMVNMI